MLYHRQLDWFQFLEDLSPPIQEASSVLTNWREVEGSQTLRGSRYGHFWVVDPTGLHVVFRAR